MVFSRGHEIPGAKNDSGNLFLENSSLWRRQLLGRILLRYPGTSIQPTHGQSGFLPNTHLHLVGPRSSSIIGSPKKAHVVPRSQVNSASAGSKAYEHTSPIFPSAEDENFYPVLPACSRCRPTAFPPRLPWLAISLTNSLWAGRFLRFSEPAGLEHKDIGQHCIYMTKKRKI